MKNRWMMAMVFSMAASVAWPFEITSFSPDGTLIFSGQAGTSSYTIQYTANLEDVTSWTGTGTLIPGTGASSYTTTVDRAAAVFRLIRVRTFADIVNDQVEISAGTFVMGSVTNAEENYAAETPQRTNNISAFFMDAHEVSLGLWNTIVDRNGSSYVFSTEVTSLGDNYPVYNVNWYDAVKWCNARSEMEGLTPVYYLDAGFSSVYKTSEVVPHVNWSANGYRLPTEAEWEKAARAGTTTRFPWGSVITHSEANYNSRTNYSYDVSTTRGFHPVYTTNSSPFKVNPVDAFAPNGGLYNMIGNVREWCWDYYQGNYYQSAPPNDPVGPTTGDNRVLRGGSWAQDAFATRVSYRDQAPPTIKLQNIGFRCVRRP